MIEHLNNTIRNCSQCTNVIPCPQPGYFLGKILIIGQNPAYPRENKWQDKILLDLNQSINRVQGAYLSTLQNSVVDQVLGDLGLAWSEVSFTNIVKCPTVNNARPDHQAVTNCGEYTLEQIKLLEPKLIVIMGKLANQALYSSLKKKYTIINIYHYAYLKRSGMYDEMMAKYKEKINNAKRRFSICKTDKQECFDFVA